MSKAEKLWELLGDVPTNEEEEIDEDFKDEQGNVLFAKGTDVYSIWHWFEEEFDISVIKLMGV